MKIGVGLSGGVDSCVAAALLQEAGHDIVGYTMTLGRADEAASLAAAREAAARLGVPLVVVDFAEAWRRDVADYVRDTYRAGATPNPCVRCNETVKFALLPARAFADGCERFATGHYARLAGDATRAGGVRLLRGADRRKDQSYFLYRVRSEILARTLLPLGELTKEEVRRLAAERGFAAADRSDSQDFCGGDAAALAGLADCEGPIEDGAGRVLGTHRGYWHYTVGMRRGLGLGGGTPYFVTRIDAARNAVVVGFREAALVRRFALEGIVRRGPCDGELSVKVRSAGEPRGPAFLEGDVAVVPDGLAGVAPGQSAVFYRGDEIVAGGLIGGSETDANMV